MKYFKDKVIVSVFLLALCTGCTKVRFNESESCSFSAVAAVPEKLSHEDFLALVKKYNDAFELAHSYDTNGDLTDKIAAYKEAVRIGEELLEQKKLLEQTDFQKESIDDLQKDIRNMQEVIAEDMKLIEGNERGY